MSSSEPKTIPPTFLPESCVRQTSSPSESVEARKKRKASALGQDAGDVLDQASSKGVPSPPNSHPTDSTEVAPLLERIFTFAVYRECSDFDLSTKIVDAVRLAVSKFLLRHDAEKLYACLRNAVYRSSYGDNFQLAGRICNLARSLMDNKMLIAKELPKEFSSSNLATKTSREHNSTNDSQSSQKIGVVLKKNTARRHEEVIDLAAIPSDDEEVHNPDTSAYALYCQARDAHYYAKCEFAIAGAVFDKGLIPTTMEEPINPAAQSIINSCRAFKGAAEQDIKAFKKLVQAYQKVAIENCRLVQELAKADKERASLLRKK